MNVRGQILNSDGVTKDGSEFMLNTALSGDQFDVALTALGNGGFAAAGRAAPIGHPIAHLRSPNSGRTADMKTML